MKLTATIFTALAFLAAACESESGDGASKALPTGVETSAPEPVTPEETDGDEKGQGVPDVNGTWTFRLELSDPAPRLRDQCARAEDVDACWAEIVAETRTEKIRFESTADGLSRWTSFTAKGGRETVGVSVVVALSTEDGEHITATVRGEPTGQFADGFTESKLQFELPETDRVVLVTPVKGRLVFERD